MLFRLSNLPNVTIPMLDDLLFDWSKDLAVRPRVFGYEIRAAGLSAMLSLPQLRRNSEDVADVAALLRSFFVRNGFSERVVMEVAEVPTEPPDPVVLNSGGGGVSPGGIAGIVLGIVTLIALATVLGVMAVRRHRQRAAQPSSAAAVVSAPNAALTVPTPGSSEVSEETHDFL